MKTIAHIRISTNKQDEASQREIISRWCNEQRRAVTEYSTDTVSGAVPWQQRGLASVLASCEPGDTIVVSEISRIARSTVGVLTFLQAAAQAQVHVIAIKTGIHLDGSTASKIVVTVLAMAAEIERDLLRDRTKAGVAARKERGLPIGRQVGAKGKRSKLDEKEAEITALLTAKVSKAAIARVLKVARGTLDAFITDRNLAITSPENATDAAAGRTGI